MNRGRADLLAFGGRAAARWAAIGYGVKVDVVRFYLPGDERPHFRCPPGTLNGGHWTDAMGTDCEIPSGRQALRSIGERVGRIAQGPTLPGERYVEGDNPILHAAYPITLTARRHRGHGIAGTVGPDGYVDIAAVPVPETGPLAKFRLALRHVIEGGNLSDVPDILLGRTLLAGRGAKSGDATGDQAAQLRWGMRMLFNPKESAAGAMGATFIARSVGMSEGGFIVKYTREPERDGMWESDAVAEVLGTEFAHRLGFPMLPGRFDGPASEKVARRHQLPVGVHGVVLEYATNLIDRPEIHKQDGVPGYYPRMIEEAAGPENMHGLMPRLQHYMFSLYTGTSDRHVENALSGVDGEGHPFVLPIDLATIGAWPIPHGYADPAAAHLFDYGQWGYTMDSAIAREGQLGAMLRRLYPDDAERAAVTAQLKQIATSYYNRLLEFQQQEMQSVIDRVTANFTAIHPDPIEGQASAMSVGKELGDKLESLLGLISVEDLFKWWGI